MDEASKPMPTDLMKRPGYLGILFCSKDAIFCRANSERKIPDRLGLEVALPVRCVIYVCT